MKNGDSGKIVRATNVKCSECGCEVLSAPMPVGKINYLPGRSMISSRPDIEIHDARMSFICTACKAFVYLENMAKKGQDGKRETGKTEEPESQKEA